MAHVRTIASATELPVSADLENGFGDDLVTVAETIRLAADRTAYTHGYLPPATTFVYYIKACNPVGCSAWSNRLLATTSRSTSRMLSTPACARNMICASCREPATGPGGRNACWARWSLWNSAWKR